MPGSPQTLSAPSVAVEVALELFRSASAEQYGFTVESWRVVLQGVAAAAVRGGAKEGELAGVLQGVHAEELALARGCASGNERAWEVFLTRYRETLYGAAYSVVKEDSAAHELADSLYAELYGLSERDGQRRSKLNFYMGRGSLAGWLRTVIAQQFVNQYRAGKKLTSLEEEAEKGVQFAATNPVPEASTPGVDAQLVSATDSALAQLDAEDRYLLSSYFLDGRKLAEIGRTLGVHESTISRKLDKITTQLRKQILQALTRQGMSRRQAEEALETDVRDVMIDLRARLAAETGPRGRPEG
jgi:RNA polymerase sigma-70 factor (ECF subfamily)